MAASQAKRAVEPIEPAAVTHFRTFDALYRRLLQVHPRISELLRAHGYDADRPCPVYPRSVWVACLEAARRELFGDLPMHEGHRALGRLFSEGFSLTPLGQVFQGVDYTGAAYLVRLRAMIQRVSPDLEVELSFESERRCTLALIGKSSHPHFVAGVVEARAVSRGGMPNATVDVTRVDATGYELRITW